MSKKIIMWCRSPNICFLLGKEGPYKQNGNGCSLIGESSMEIDFFLHTSLIMVLMEQRCLKLTKCKDRVQRGTCNIMFLFLLYVLPDLNANNL